MTTTKYIFYAVFFISTSLAQTNVFMEVGDIVFPFDNKGNLSIMGAQYTGREIITYRGISIIFSGGFFLSGYANNKLWVNAQSSVALVQDYLPGRVSPYNKNSIKKICSLTTNDKHFGESWENWKNAVYDGAYYYDGDKNGIYNPVDLNSNGKWDINEDRPDLLFDKTYFTVYNDGVQSDNRRWLIEKPLGIEIRQTVFASTNIDFLKNTVFIRYSIVNRGFEADTLNDVVFSFFIDPDIGSLNDDLVGCDTTIQSAFTYNNGPDEMFEDITPAIFYTLIQGPSVKTNSLSDTAFINYGPLIGSNILPGYSNVGIGSHTIPGISRGTDYDYRIAQRYLSLGKDLIGYPFNIFGDTIYGKVIDINCHDVNTKFWFSGDPVNQTGWLNIKPYDQRQYLNTEKFKLVKDEPQDLIVAYSVGQGYFDVPSLSVGREIAKIAIEECRHNFPNSLDFDPSQKEPPELNYNYRLEQNFPNPFNPTTKIKYSVAQSQFITLKVFSPLGKEVKTLVNTFIKPGNYEITFDASQLASGVYFYRLSAGDFVQTKKMMVLK